MSTIKLVFPILSLFYFLSSCNNINISNQSKGNIDNCPQPAEELPKIKITSAEDVFTAFDYRIRDITADADTISFQSPNYDFVFCRGNNNWTVQPKTLNQPANDEVQTDLANPSYETIELNQTSYQYRVILDPNPFPNFQAEPEKVIFELILPGNEQPQRQVVYTLEQTKQAQTGIQLGVPTISKVLIWNNRLFWSISPEQGEGNGGIATIVSYNPQTDKISLIQPEEIAGQQINDFVISGEASNPTIWLATQMSGEGNPYLPSMGLVAYHSNSEDFTYSSLAVYHVRNSPIIGAIPTKLSLEKDELWLGTGNGICQIEWQTVDDFDSWDCWRFALMAELSGEEIPLYYSLLAENPATTIQPKQNTIEVLWWLPQNNRDSNSPGRYEVPYQPGFTVTLDDRGVISWTDLYQSPQIKVNWKAPFYWVGKDWSWNGNVFVRGFDQVPLNYFGGGFTGINQQEYSLNNLDINAMRGDLELIELSPDATTLKHFSGWVSDRVLEPYLTIIPVKNPSINQPNPLVSLPFSKN